MSVAQPLDLKPFWESKYGPTPPVPIWETIFKLVAQDSRAYFIPMRCVCKAWSAIIVKLGHVRFINPMTRLLEVSARDALTRLCIWAHTYDGVVTRDALISSARGGDVGLVNLICEWRGEGWNDDGDGSFFLSDEEKPEFFVRMIGNDMLDAAIESERERMFEYLMEKLGTVPDMLLLSAVPDMLLTAVRVNSVPMIRLIVELIDGGGYILKQYLCDLAACAARHGSLRALEHLEGSSESHAAFWSIAFVGAAIGGHDIVYDAAKLHLSRLGIPLTTRFFASSLFIGPRGKSIIKTALLRALVCNKPEMVARLIVDGANRDPVMRRANDRKDPALGRLVIGHSMPGETGTVITDRIVAEWEQVRAKRRRVIPLDLGEGYLSE